MGTCERAITSISGVAHKYNGEYVGVVAVGLGILPVGRRSELSVKIISAAGTL